MASFYIDFDNKPCHVLVDRIANPVHRSMYYLRFENGYENVFFTDSETGEWIEQDLGYTLLAKTFGTLVDGNKAVACDTLKKRITWFIENQELKVIFGFNKKVCGKTLVYDIFGSNRRYMFTLIRNIERWQVLNNYAENSWNFSMKCFQEIPFLLEINEL